MRLPGRLRAWLPMAPFILILGGFVLSALLADVVAPRDPLTQNLLGRLRAPGSTARGIYYVLGSDELGRDLLSRLIHGSRVSLLVAFVTVLVAGTIGSALGIAAALLRGPAEAVIMRVADMVLAVPAILLAVIVVAVLGPGLTNVILVLAIARWPRYARVAYAQTLVVAQQPYVRLARFIGASWPWIVWRHILPNILGALVVVATLEFGIMVLFEAGLSFLGLGVQPPTPSWGAMLATGRDYVETAWWLAVAPGLCLFLLVLSANVLGDHLRDRLDPHLA